MLLGLMLIRLALRAIQGTPPYSQPLPAVSRIIGAVVHLALYGVLVAMPVVGWLGTAASGYPVQFFDWTLPGLIAKDPAVGERLMGLHGLLGWVLIVLIVLHVAAGMRHWLLLKDGVMKRMSLF